MHNEDETRPLGEIEDVLIKSLKGPFHRLPQYVTTYPQVVVEALGELFLEYNRGFVPLIESNRIWKEDYRLAAYGGSGGSPVNFAVQIDMVGLSEPLLNVLATLPVGVVREFLRGKIFEIENSLAMYQLLEKIFSYSGDKSLFQKKWRKILSAVHRRQKMPVALLAVTEAKYQAMLREEFGLDPEHPFDQSEVGKLSGFSAFMGPDQFRAHLAENNGECKFQLYVRSSDPLSKLENPRSQVDHPLLSDPSMLKVIKEHAITFNIDAKDQHGAARINDTKLYMPRMGMGYYAATMEDVLSQGLLAHLEKMKPVEDFSAGAIFCPMFERYLRSVGCNEEVIQSGDVRLRGKPATGTYGCYGHVRGTVLDSSRHCMRRELADNLRHRPGGYVLQPELPVPRITNEMDGTTYAFIDRNFMGIRGDGKPVYLGGFRTMLPTDSEEVKQGRLHGNGATVWAEIVAGESTEE